MNLLRHDRKRFAEESPEEVPTRVCKAIIYGGSIIVPDERSSNHIHTHGTYGHYLIEREEKFVRNATSDGPFENNTANRLWEPSRVWREVALVNDQLYLSPEETAFLSIDMNLLLVSENKKELTSDELWLRLKDLGGPAFVKRFALYRFLRRKGWCVRSGLPYGCDYLIYRDGPDAYHAAAGVKMESQVEPQFFIGMNRALSNTKKSLMIVTPLVPEGLDTSKHSCADSVEISMSTSVTMFVDRKMNDIKAKEYKMYRRGLKRKACE